MDSNSFRAQRTKMMIKDAYWELLADYKRQKITVNDICEVLHCSRKTFYSYYEAKEILHNDIIADLIGCMDQDLISAIAASGTDERIHETFASVFSSIRDRAWQFRILFNRDDADFLNALYDFFKSPSQLSTKLEVKSPEDDLKLDCVASICANLLRYACFYPDVDSYKISNLFFELMSDTLLDWLHIARPFSD